MTIHNGKSESVHLTFSASARLPPKTQLTHLDDESTHLLALLLQVTDRIGSSTNNKMAPPAGQDIADCGERTSNDRSNTKLQSQMPSLTENRVWLGSICFQRAEHIFDSGSHQTDRDRTNDASELIARIRACPNPTFQPKVRVDCDTRLQGDKKRSMSRVVSSPSLGKMNLNDDSSREIECRSQSPVVKSKKARIRNSISAPALDRLGTLGGGSGSTVCFTNDTSQDPFANANPQDHLRTILESMGISADTRPALSMVDFFLETTPEHTVGYGPDIINAVCQEDLDAMARIRDSGATLQCCNKFGESIVHMACRRGSISVLRYLLRNGVSIRLSDDYGRTPLHDACWTQKPNFELVKSVISECPDLLLITDKRGFTPLSYVRREHWGECCKFLQDHQDLVVPRQV